MLGMDSFLLGAGTAVLCIIGCLAAPCPLLQPDARGNNKYPKYCQMHYLEQNCPSLRTIDTNSAVFLLRFKRAKWSLEHYNEYFGRRAEGEEKEEEDQGC